MVDVDVGSTAMLSADLSTPSSPATSGAGALGPHGLGVGCVLVPDTENLASGVWFPVESKSAPS